MRYALVICLVLCGACGGGGGGSDAPAPVAVEVEVDDPEPLQVPENFCPDSYTMEVPLYADVRDPHSRYVVKWTKFYDDDCNITRIVY